MCDYSLIGMENRLAEEGEVLVVHRFYSGSKGLTSPAYLKAREEPSGWMAFFKGMFRAPSRVCAVCIPDGARLMLRGIPAQLQHSRSLGSDEAVTFRQLSPDAGTYRDAVEFRNGARVLLQDLEEGQQVDVLAVSAERAAALERRSIPAGA